jgi:hypothetical protein
MLLTDDVHYCASYVPENLEFAVLGTTQILKDITGIAYPLVKETIIGDNKFISRSYDDVYLIPIASRLKYTKEAMEIPLELKYDEYIKLKQIDLKDFKLDDETETLFVRYPLSFTNEVDEDINFKLHEGKLYKRIKLSDHGTIVTDDWELIHSGHPFVSSFMNDMVEDILKDLLFEEPENENEY